MTSAEKQFFAEARKLRVSARDGYILVIEDDPDISEFITRALEQNGLKVRVAAAYSEALELLKKDAEKIRAAIIDIGLPGSLSDGAYLDDSIVSLAESLQIPFIVWTGYKAEQIARKHPRACVVRKGESGALNRIMSELGLTPSFA